MQAYSQIHDGTFFYIEHFKLCVKSSSHLSQSQIEKKVKKLTAFLKTMVKERQIHYARKASYDGFLGLQIDVLITAKDSALKESVIRFWQDLINTESYGDHQSFYHYECSNWIKTNEEIGAKQIKRFVANKWLFPCVFDSHFTLEIPFMRNFSKSR